MAFALEGPTEIEIRQGESKQLLVRVLATSKPYRSVTLSISELPPGIMASPKLLSGKPSYDAMITLTAAPDAPIGDYQCRVTGRDAKSRKEL